MTEFKNLKAVTQFIQLHDITATEGLVLHAVWILHVVPEVLPAAVLHLLVRVLLLLESLLEGCRARGPHQLQQRVRDGAAEVRGAHHVAEVAGRVVRVRLLDARVQTVVYDGHGLGQELAARAHAVTRPRVEAVGAVAVRVVAEDGLAGRVLHLHDAVVRGVHLPGRAVHVLVQTQVRVVEEEIDEGLGGKTDGVGHVEDLEVGTRDADVGEQLDADGLAVAVRDLDAAGGELGPQLQLRQLLVRVQAEAEEVAQRQEQVLGVGVGLVGEPLHGAAGEDGGVHDVALGLLVRVEDEVGVVVAAGELPRVEAGPADDQLAQLRPPLLAEVPLDRGVQVGEDRGDVEVDILPDGAVPVPGPLLRAEVEHEVADLVGDEDAGHRLHHEGGGAAEAAAAHPLLPDLVVAAPVLVRPGVVRQVAQVLLVRLPRARGRVLAGEEQLEHLAADDVPRGRRQLRLEVELQRGQEAGDEPPQQRGVEHGELDVGVAGGLQEAEVLHDAQLLEAGHKCRFWPLTGHSGHCHCLILLANIFSQHIL